MTYLDEETMKDLWDVNIQGSFPFLVRIYNPDIFWTDEEKAVYKQEDGYMNFISDNTKVVYKGKTWLPCGFQFSPPPKDGKKLGSASISISALDARVKKLIRTIQLPSEFQIVALYQKSKNEKDHTVYKFVELNSVKMKATSSSSSKATASFNLVPEMNLQQNIPYDTAIISRVPSGTK